MYALKFPSFIGISDEDADDDEVEFGNKKSFTNADGCSWSTTSKSEEHQTFPENEISRAKNCVEIVNNFLLPKLEHFPLKPRTAQKPDLGFEFSNKQVAAEKKISGIIGDIVSLAVLKENTVFINWMKIRQGTDLKRFVFLTLSGFNGKDISSLCAAGHLPFLQSVSNEWTTFEVENPKVLVPETHFWENLFEAPNLKSKTSHLPKNDRLYSYLASESDMAACDYPNERNPRCLLYKNTKDWRLGQLSAFCRSAVAKQTQNKVSRLVTIDCEMVKTVKGLELAKITALDEFGNLLLDEYCYPSSPIINYNTSVSGITAHTLRNVRTQLPDIQRKLQQFVDSSTILLGHSLNHDLHAIQLIHHRVIDTALVFSVSGRKQSLKSLVKDYLGISFQENSHESYQDAIHTLALFKLKSEILDLHGLCANTPDFGKIKKIVDSRRVAIVERSDQLGWLRNCGAQVVTHMNNNLENVVQSVQQQYQLGAQCIFAKACSSEVLGQIPTLVGELKWPTLSPISELQQLDTFLTSFSELLEEETLVVVATLNPELTHRKVSIPLGRCPTLHTNTEISEDLSPKISWDPARSLANKVIAFVKEKPR